MRRSVFIIVIGLATWMSAADVVRPLTIEDCIQTRHVVRNEVKLSPNGDRVAFLVQTVDFHNNRNEYELYVRKLKTLVPRENGVRLWQSEGLSGLRWTSDGNALIVLSNNGTGSRILRIDAAGHGYQTIVSSPRKIDEYAADANARVVAFSQVLIKDERPRLARELRWGYSVGFGDPVFSHFSNFFTSRSQYEIVVVRRDQKVTRALTKIERADSLVLGERSALLGVRFLSVSPNGRFLTFTHLVKQVPNEWQTNGFVRYLLQNHTPVTVLGFYDLVGHGFRKNVFPSPCFAGPVRWSDDSKAFAVVAGPPIDTVWEKRLEREKPVYSFDVGLYEDMYLFAVNLQTDATSRVTAGKDLGRYTMSAASAPLTWKRADQEMTITVDGDSFAKFLPNGSEWKAEAKFTQSIKRSGRDLTVSSDGKKAIGLFQTTTDPPELFVFNFSSGATNILTNLNVEYSHIALGQVEELRWNNSYGAECSGYLIKPVGYVAGQRYPLVIMAKDWDASFISDTQYHTAFAPQSLASAGMAVLLANDPSKAQEPKTYPGQIGEAYNWMEMVKSAVDRLVSDGLANERSVGIVGFSRTSWKVDFMLTHSDFRFAAASSADGGNYNYSTYSIANLDGRMKVDEAMYDGPPYGKTLANWLEYAPAFNAEKVSAPLLMEYNGSHSVLWFPGLELFTALQKQGKAVELYYYANGDHVLDSPSERLASLTRNVAWFRFWLQGYEGLAPAFDPELYIRWRALRSRQNEDMMHLGSSRS